MYYVLEADHRALVTHLNYTQGGGWGLDFLYGHLVEIPKNQGDLYVTVEHTQIDLPDYIEVDGVPIVTDKFIDILDTAGVDSFQAIPVEIRFEDGVQNDRFLINVVGRISCIDEDVSDCSKFGPCIARIFNLKLNENAPKGAFVFRADEYQEIIFLKEHVKVAIEGAGITGCELRLADGWNDAHRF